MLFQSENHGYPLGETVAYEIGREHGGGFWGAGNGLFHNLGTGYIGAQLVKIWATYL